MGSKQFNPWSDAVFCGVWSGIYSLLRPVFPMWSKYGNLIKSNRRRNNPPSAPARKFMKSTVVDVSSMMQVFLYLRYHFLDCIIETYVPGEYHSGKWQPASVYRMNIHISACFSLIRWKISNLTFFEHMWSSILSITSLKCKYINSILQIVPIYEITFNYIFTEA